MLRSASSYLLFVARLLLASKPAGQPASQHPASTQPASRPASQPASQQPANQPASQPPNTDRGNTQHQERISGRQDHALVTLIETLNVVAVSPIRCFASSPTNKHGQSGHQVCRCSQTNDATSKSAECARKSTTTLTVRDRFRAERECPY